MDNLNANQTLTGPKRLLQDGTMSDYERNKRCLEALNEMESKLENFLKENLLRDELLSKLQQLAEAEARSLAKQLKLDETQRKLDETQQQLTETQQQLVETKKESGTEILRLNQLLSEKNATHNYTAPVSPETTAEVEQKQMPVSSRAKTVPASVNATVHLGSIQDEARELDCCRVIHVSGNGPDESSSSCVYHILAESLAGMEFSLNKETEGCLLSVCHKATGYSFTLKWLEKFDGAMWMYKCSSLGTLKGSRAEWMDADDIRFSMEMCSNFFERIWSVIKKGQ